MAHAQHLVRTLLAHLRRRPGGSPAPACARAPGGRRDRAGCPPRGTDPLPPAGRIRARPGSSRPNRNRDGRPPPPRRQDRDQLVQRRVAVDARQDEAVRRRERQALERDRRGLRTRRRLSSPRIASWIGLEARHAEDRPEDRLDRRQDVGLEDGLRRRRLRERGASALPLEDRRGPRDRRSPAPSRRWRPCRSSRDGRGRGPARGCRPSHRGWPGPRSARRSRARPSRTRHGPRSSVPPGDSANRIIPRSKCRRFSLASCVRVRIPDRSFEYRSRRSPPGSAR